MKNIGNQRGAITLLVLVTMIFFATILASTYILISNKAQSQIEITEQTRRIYKTETEEETYNSFIGGNVIPIYTATQLLKIGSGEKIQIDEDEGKIYIFEPSASYLIMNDLEFDYEGVWEIPSNIEIDGNGHEVKIRDTSKPTEEYYTVID